MDDEFESRGGFDVDRYCEQQERGFVQEFGWPDIADEGYTGEEGEGELW